MADFIVYTYDNLDAVAAVLNGVASIMGGSASGYRDMIRTLGTLGLLVAIISFLVNPTRIAAFSWFGGFMFVYFLLFLPVTRVNIVDVVRTGEARTVDNVPAALALTASVSSTVGLKLTQVFETVMQALPVSLGDGTSTPTACVVSPDNECMLRFSQGGMMFGNKLLGRIEQAARDGAAIADPNVEKDMYEFLSQCTAFDLSQHRIRYEDVSKSTDLWATIANTSPARYVTEAEVFKDCPSAYASLSTRRQAVGVKLETMVARAMFPNLSDTDAKRRLNNAYKDVAQATSVGNAGWEVKQFLLQNTLVNQAKRGLGRMGMEAGSTSAVMLGQAEAATFAGTNASFITQSRLAEEALPLIRNGIEAILYGIFPVVVLVMMVQSGPALVAAIKGFVFAFVWIQLWPPLYALVNYIGQVRSMQSLKIIVASMRGAPGEAVGVAFANYNNIYNGQISDQAVMGYLIIAVPVIASSIIYGMNSAMGAIGGGSFIGTAGRAGEAAGSGNVNMGNVSMGQQSLGPSRTDADVFSHNSTGGSFKYGLAEGNAEFLSGSFNSTSGPFRISLASQSIASLKDSYSEKIGLAETESRQLSAAVSSTFGHNLASNQEFARYVEGKTGYSVGTSGSKGHGVTDSAGLGGSGGMGASEMTGGATEQSVQHRTTAGFQMFGSGGNKSNTAVNKGTDSVQEGTMFSNTGEIHLSSQEQLSLLSSFEQSKGYGTGDRSNVSASEGNALSFQQASQQLDSLQRQISHAKEVSSSLETMESNKATVEQDLLHRATQGLNREMGDATYVQGLGDDEKREQLTAYATKHFLVEQYGLNQQEAASLVGSSREGYNIAGVGHDGGRASAGAAGLDAAGTSNYLGGTTSATIQAPGAAYASHKGAVNTYGVSAHSQVSNKDVMAGSAQGVTDLSGQIGEKSPLIKDKAISRMTGADAVITDRKQMIGRDGDELRDNSALGTVVKSAGMVVSEVATGQGKALNAVVGTDLATPNSDAEVQNALSVGPERSHKP